MLSACRENDERNRGRQIILRLNPPVLPHALNPAAVVGNSAELIACSTVARAAMLMVHQEPSGLSGLPG